MSGSERSPLDAVLAFVRAAQTGDIDAMRMLMADRFSGHITTAGGGVRDADRDQYLESIEAMDVRSANLRLDVPNAVAVGPGLVLAMIEVHAERGDRRLHNHSGQLARVEDGLLTELWMVDALPDESDGFWSTPAG